MRLSRAILLAGVIVALVLAAIWLGGGFATLRLWAEAGARQVQRDIAQAVRAIATGQPGALAGLLTVGFAYGFFHAAGPGHGKLLIGGYGLARQVPLRRLAGLALAASIAQASVAVAMVYALVLGLGWARGHVDGLADLLFLPLSHAAIIGIALWLVLRGLRGIRRRGPRAAPRIAANGASGGGLLLPGQSRGGAVLLGGHDHGPDCGCGQAHGPTLDQVAEVTSWRAAVALIAAIALRPCSGALFLLVVSWQMGIAGAGIAGVYAMGLGTATVTLLVAALAVWSRAGVMAGAAALWPGRLARLAPMLELSVGAVLLMVALPLFWASLDSPAATRSGDRPGLAAAPPAGEARPVAP